MLSDSDRFQLQKMVAANNTEDHTTKIRELKHSAEIRRCLAVIAKLKTQNLNKADLETHVLDECRFLFLNYFEIYTMVMKDVDITILHRLLDVLEQIENETCDQHEGSFLVGKLLKEIYIDGTLRETSARDTPDTRVIPKAISWSQFKQKI